MCWTRSCDRKPVGVPGELCVAGQSLPRGYRGRPDLTAEKFITHPFSALPGARLFKTGDQVKRLPDGALEFLGRQDFQIKVRGSVLTPGRLNM